MTAIVILLIIALLAFLAWKFIFKSKLSVFKDRILGDGFKKQVLTI